MAAGVIGAPRRLLLGTVGAMSDAYLDVFLLARAAEVDDDETQDIITELVGELRDIDDAAVVDAALWMAARFSDHPDYSDDWRQGSDATVQIRGR